MAFLQDVQVLIPGTCVSVTLHGKGAFADLIMLKILKWADYPGSSRETQPDALSF